MKKLIPYIAAFITLSVGIAFAVNTYPPYPGPRNSSAVFLVDSGSTVYPPLPSPRNSSPVFVVDPTTGLPVVSIGSSTWGGRGAGFSIAGTVYWASFFSNITAITSSELLSSIPLPYNAIASGLTIFCATAPGAGKNTVATLRVNAATPSNGLVATLTGAGVFLATDFTHTVTLSKGDAIILQVVADSGGSAPNNCVFSIAVTPR